ncbi:MAG: response regulator [Nitrospiraceae bacterium]|nr:response regulator [Nitrospiraceae bacterium]
MPTTVLIADDDTVSRGLIRMVLEYDGCRCLEAEDGTATLSVLGKHHIDLLILDYMMPKLTGLEVLQTLYQSSHLEPLPTIMITGMLQPSIREMAIQLGVFAILEKPYDLGELRALVAHIGTTDKSSEPEGLLTSFQKPASFR